MQTGGVERQKFTRETSVTPGEAVTAGGLGQHEDGRRPRGREASPHLEDSRCSGSQGRKETERYSGKWDVTRSDTGTVLGTLQLHWHGSPGILTENEIPALTNSNSGKLQ